MNIDGIIKNRDKEFLFLSLVGKPSLGRSEFQFQVTNMTLIEFATLSSLLIQRCPTRLGCRYYLHYQIGKYSMDTIPLGDIVKTTFFIAKAKTQIKPKYHEIF